VTQLLAAKMKDVVGLYLDPPDNAIVLSVDEKTSIQALGRTQLPLPARQGRAARPGPGGFERWCPPRELA